MARFILEKDISIDMINKRSPRLDTVRMVEDFIREHDGEFNRKNLWKSLPKGMMYQTFKIILDYLVESHKISVDSKGKVGWIYYPRISQSYHGRADLGR